MGTIYTKLDDWRRQLLDLSKRNPLINTKLGQRGALEFEWPTAESVWQQLVIDGIPLTFVWKRDLLGEDLSEGTSDLTLYTEDEESTPNRRSSPVVLEDCLASPDLEHDHILTRLSDRVLATRLNRIALNAKTSLDEQGVNILFVTFGLLRWYESPDSDISVYSPLLLVPVQVNRASREASWKISLYEDEVVPNLCLNEMLRTSFKLELPELPANGFEDADNRENYFDSVRDVVSVCPRWELLDKVTLGTFSFQKVAMWKDLGDNAERVASHDLCRAIAGDATVAIVPTASLPSPREFDDRIRPQDLYTILNCDSSQLEAILAVKNGTSLVLDGPPGTGKSQTIANIIAESLANKRSVLFVSEKAAALEVVKRRLDASRLGDFCLECHSHKANKKEVVAELGRCLSLQAEEYRDQRDDLKRLEDARAQLNQYVRALHNTHGSLGLTPYAAHGRLATLKPSCSSRWTSPDVLAMTPGTLRQITERLTGLPRCRQAIEDYEAHPWNGCRMTTFSLTARDDIQHGFLILAEAVESLAQPLLVLQEANLVSEHPTMKDLEDGLAMTREALRYPELSPAWFAADPKALANRVVKLAAASVAYRGLLASLPQFRPDLVAIESAQTLNRLHSSAVPWVKRIRGQSGKTIRGERRRVCTVISELAIIQQTLSEIQLAVDDLTREMNLPLAPVTSVGLLHGLVTLGKSVARTSLVNSNWFDKSRRDVVKLVASSCQSELFNAGEIRRTLSSRLRPEAFELEGAVLSKEAQSFTSFWSRLFGGWRRFKSRLQNLYLDGELLRTPELLEDMRQLQAFHEKRQFVQRTEADNAESLVRDSSGNVKWNIVIAGIEAIEQLERMLKRIPDRLRATLTTDGALDRDAVSNAASALDELLIAFAKQVRAGSRVYAVNDVAEEGKSFKDMPPDALAKWLSDAESSLKTHVELLDDVIALLNEDDDAVIEDLPDCAQRFQKSQLLREEILKLAREVETIIGNAENPERTDWSAYAEDARWLLSFLESIAERRRVSLIPLITNSEIRARIMEAESQASAIVAGQFAQGWETLLSTFDVDARATTGLIISAMPLDELVPWLRARIADIDRLQEWISFRETEQALRELGVGTILDEVVRGEVPLAEARDAFLARFFRLWLDAVYQKDSKLRKFDLDAHEELLSTFRELDDAVVAGGYKRIRASLLQDPDRPHSGMVNAPANSEVGILLNQVTRKRGHLPLRQLFRRIPTLLRRIKPCVMMSPLAVSTYLDSASGFDVVIFDEASQVRPFDAIGAIYRGAQLVVAGDQKQLPPTSFFDRLMSDEYGGESNSDDADVDVDSNLGDFESILDVCCSIGMPRKRLRWHYRSRREPLIAFSNYHFYGNELVTFPSVHDVDSTSAVRFHFVGNGKWKSGTSGGVNPVEARETAELVLKHISDHPGQSLGVITFNQRQQFAVLDQLEEFRSMWPDLDAFFDDSREEPFFVKNLENVQGDERDRIIISVGYGYDEFGKFAMRFGPLNRQGGERRMNVAVTRAKHQVVLVSSIRGADIDLCRTRSVGARLLRAYLEYAERGIETLGREIAEDSQRESDSDFEDEVARELGLRGLSVRRQVGCGGYRIDLALVHPETPGRYLLGIECDGASYHSSATARDRDRLRQAVLESLGWKLCRIWSTDWVRNPARQIDRVCRAYQDALVNSSEVPLPSGKAVEGPSRHEERPIVRLRQIAPKRARSTGRYAKIEDVPDHVLKSSVLDVLRRYGQTSQDELIRAVAQDLGFRRVGKKIHSGISRAIQRLVQDEKLKQSPEEFLSAS